MNFSKEEEKIMGPFYHYITIPKPKKELYLLKWKYGTTIYAKSDIIYESDNNLDPDDPSYEDFIEIVINIESLVYFDSRDKLDKKWLQKDHLIGLNYHNFPDEIYNSRGGLISKREN